MNNVEVDISLRIKKIKTKIKAVSKEFKTVGDLLFDFLDHCIHCGKTMDNKNYHQGAHIIIGQFFQTGMQINICPECAINIKFSGLYKKIENLIDREVSDSRQFEDREEYLSGICRNIDSISGADVIDHTVPCLTIFDELHCGMCVECCKKMNKGLNAKNTK